MLSFAIQHVLHVTAKDTSVKITQTKAGVMVMVAFAGRLGCHVCAPTMDAIMSSLGDALRKDLDMLRSNRF